MVPIKQGIISTSNQILLSCIFFVFTSSVFSQQIEITDTSYFVTLDDNYNLILSAYNDDLANVKLLLGRGAEVDAATPDGVSPLMYATQNGNLEMVKLLVDSGANMNLTPFDGTTPLIASARQNLYDISEFLAGRGADLNLRDVEGLTAVHYAAAFNHYDIMDMLIFHGADKELPDKDGNTPLITAAYNNSLEAVDLLIQNGADMNARDKNGFSAIMVSIKQRNTDITNLLIQYGADVNLVNAGGYSALAFAVMNSDDSLSWQLVESGADVNLKIKSEGTILDLAKKTKDHEIISLLEKYGATENPYPFIDRFQFGILADWNLTDFMNGVQFGISESKYQTGISAGFIFRPSANRILADYSEDTYQFWERKYIIYLGLEKGFKIIETRRNLQTGPCMGIREMISWGNYRGSTLHPDIKLITSPSAGWYLRKPYFGLTAEYHYLNLHTFDINPNRFSILIYFIFRTSSGNKAVKKINWLENI
jgi:ankyrin repeat protein